MDITLEHFFLFFNHLSPPLSTSDNYWSLSFLDSFDFSRVTIQYIALQSGTFHLSFLVGLGSKESACNMGDLGSVPGLGRSSEEGNDDPLERGWYSTLLFFPGEFLSLSTLHLRFLLFHGTFLIGLNYTDIPHFFYSLRG